MRLAIIGGTGVTGDSLVPNLVNTVIETPYGTASVQQSAEPGSYGVLLFRHGAGHRVPPHQINYRANIWALRSLGIEGIIATSAVGSLHRDLQPGSLLLIDSFLDFTSGRPFTFFDGADGQVRHTDMTYPYCNTIRTQLSQVAEEEGIPLVKHGCYVCTNGPRYETAAEIRAFAMLGGDVVGMTGLPEVVLARELGMCYASVALVTNLGAGLSPEKLAHEHVVQVMQSGGHRMARLIGACIKEMAGLVCPSC